MDIEFQIQLTCDFCDKETALAVVSSRHGWTIETANAAAYRSKHNIVDSRCADCEATHGSFKEMAEAYIEQTGDDWVTAEQVVKANPSKATFELALDARVQEVLAAQTLDVQTAQPSDIINTN